MNFFPPQLTNNFNGGDSYTAPPLDSYAPGKYAPSFLQPRPGPGPQHRPGPPRGHPIPPPPSKNYLPQRPPPAPRPQYIPPVPMKILRPQGPAPGYRPQGNNHAHSVAQGYQSHSSQSQIHSSGPVHHPPARLPLPHRAPVPPGLFQSIGQHVQALDNGQRGQPIGNTYLPPPAHELPIPPMKLMLPNPQPSQPFLSQHQSHSSGSASSYSNQQEFRNVHIIHDCGKGPQFAQNYAAPPPQSYAAPPQQSYGAPAGKPADSYGTPLGQPLEHYEAPSNPHGLSSNYEIPTGALEVPAHNSIDFNSVSNSYGPPASGPASIEVLGLESQQRANTIESSEHPHIASAASESQDAHAALPGLSTGLSGSGLNFISAQKSHAIEVPTSNGPVGQTYQLQFTESHSDHSSNRIDAPNHQQILADGLLQSILSAIEQKPSQTVPQVTEDLETDHSEVQVFLKSPQGQDVLADKPVASHDAHQ